MRKAISCLLFSKLPQKLYHGNIPHILKGINLRILLTKDKSTCSCLDGSRTGFFFFSLGTYSDDSLLMLLLNQPLVLCFLFPNLCQFKRHIFYFQTLLPPTPTDENKHFWLLYCTLSLDLIQKIYFLLYLFQQWSHSSRIEYTVGGHKFFVSFFVMDTSPVFKTGPQKQCPDTHCWIYGDGQWLLP